MKLKIKDREFRTFIAKDELTRIVQRLASEIDADCGGSDLLVCPVLTGAFVFAADLLRSMKTPCEVAFVKYTSYVGMESTGRVTCGLPFPSGVRGRDVLIVEDVVDSGLSMAKMIAELKRLQPRSVKVCALFYKPHAFTGGFKVDYVGKEIGDEFIAGYGMDYDEAGRTIDEVMVVGNIGS